MAKKFNAQAYREECKKNLEELTKELKKVENKIRRLYKDAPAFGEEEHHTFFCNKIYPLTKEEDSLKDKIADLSIETLEKKYVSEYLWSDVHAYEVLEEINENKYLIRRLKATVTDKAKKALNESFVPGGFCGHFDNSLQEWTFESDEKATPFFLKRNKKGRWHPEGVRPSTVHWHVLARPYEHYDYNY